jgi:hypothetical protein
MRRWSTGVLAGVVFAGATGVALAACSGGGQAEQEKNAPIAVQTSQLSVTIENKAGLPLSNIDVAILPVGGATEFKQFIGRLENAEKHEFGLGDFNGRDGTPFSLRVIRPKAVRVTAKDINDKSYKVEVPWK